MSSKTDITAGFMDRKKRTGVMIALGVLSTLGPFSIDMYLPSFSAVAADLRVTIADVGYSLTSYFVGISVGQLIYGPLLDRFGRKRPLLFGLMLYFAAAVACALAPTLEWLVAARLFMALGACVGLVASRAIVRDLFPVSETAAIFSALMLVVAVSPALAPSFGGLLSASIGWRYIFVTLSVISAVLTVVIYVQLPESRGPDSTVSLRPRRVLRQYADVARDRRFLTSALASGLAFAGLFAYIGGAPTLFMRLFGLTQEQFAIVFAVNASGIIIGSQINRLLLRKLSTGAIALAFVTAESVLGVLLLGAVLVHVTSLAVYVALLFGVLFCLGFVNPNTTALALEPISHNAGTASALLGAIQMIAGALATGIVSLLAGGTAVPMAATMLASAALSWLVFVLYRRGPDGLAPRMREESGKPSEELTGV